MDKCEDGDSCPRVFETTGGDIIVQGYDDVPAVPLAQPPAGERQVRIPRESFLQLVDEMTRQEPLRQGAVTAGVQRSLFRLEVLQEYRVEAEAERFQAFCEGRSLPARKSSAWYDQIRESVAAGMSWKRVHVVRRPLTDYIKFELLSYRSSAALGYETLIADAEGQPQFDELRQDFYLLDDEVAVLMNYDDVGHYLGSWRTRDPEVIATCRRHRDIALAKAGPLEAYIDLVGLDRSMVA